MFPVVFQLGEHSGFGSWSGTEFTSMPDQGPKPNKMPNISGEIKLN